MSGKTRKAISKRFRITKHKKLVHRLPHQCHLNAKKTGNEKRRKRHPKIVKSGMTDNIIEYKNR